MNKHINTNYIKSLFIAVVLIVAAGSVFAQKHETLTPDTPDTPNTESMTYQGRLMNGGSPANGNYDFIFQVTNGSGTVLQTVEALGVPVSNGIFTARVSMNVSTFASAGGTFLTVGVRHLPTDPYITLAPSQPVSATPVAFKAHYATQAGSAANASLLNGIASDQFVLTGDSRLSDAREPLPGSASYIQNSNSATQQIADFNIAGSGNASVFNARDYFALNSFVVLASPGSGNIFAGVGAGASNTTGADNAIFGREAGFNNATGSGNAFFGAGAGKYTTLSGNSFFGTQAGYWNSTGLYNAFFGKSAGFANTTGGWNTFLGYEAGSSNVVGDENVFVGFQAGRKNIGSSNTFVGSTAGSFTTTGSGNAFFGEATGKQNTTGNNNSFFGSGAGGSNTTGYSNTYVGNVAGSSNSTGIENVFVGRSAGLQNTIGSSNIFIGTRAGWGANGSLNDDGSFNIAIGAQTTIGGAVTNSVVIGHGATVLESNKIILGAVGQDTTVSGKLRITSIPTGGSGQLCADFFNTISLCSSSIRFKEKVDNFSGGLDLVKRLRPVSFNWKQDGMRDVGFIAEEVAEVEPLLASRNGNGDVYGVKYDRISTALVNGMNEQQAQIESLQTRVSDQQKKLQQQQEQIDALVRIICAENATVAVCKDKE